MRAVGIVALVLCACNGSSEGARAPAAAGDTNSLSVAFTPRLEGPYELERVAVAIDGTLHYAKQKPGDDPVEVARLRLPPGEHTISLLATASYPCGLDGHRGAASARAAEVIRVSGDPITVDVTVFTGSPTKTFDQRLAVDVRVRGASVVASPPRSVATETACPAMPEHHATLPWYITR
jgi:hypothetical protein